MEISLLELANVGTKQISSAVTFDKIDDKHIKKLDSVTIDGIIRYNVLDEIELDLNVLGTMFLEDSITLDEIPYDFNFKIEDTLEKNNPEYANYFKNNQNILDISEILWENIVLEVPISFTKSQNISLSGQGWEFNSSDKQEDNCNSKLAELKDIFKGGE